MVADLRKSYSEDNLPTAPWRFPLSFIPFLVLYVFLIKVRISPKVTIACNGFCLLRHTKIWLARDIISYNGTMFSLYSRVLYYIVNFEIKPWTNSFCCFSSVICYHTAALRLFAITQLL